jgi:hypothetical protein
MNYCFAGLINCVQTLNYITDRKMKNTISFGVKLLILSLANCRTIRSQNNVSIVIDSTSVTQWKLDTFGTNGSRYCIYLDFFYKTPGSINGYLLGQDTMFLHNTFGRPNHVIVKKDKSIEYIYNVRAEKNRSGATDFIIEYSLDIVISKNKIVYSGFYVY